MVNEEKPYSRYRDKPDNCVLCERQVSLTFHHLIPRKMHRRTYYRKHFDRNSLAKGIWICRKCHNGLHNLYDEMTLAKKFNTLEALREDTAIQKHVQWVAKQRVS